MGWHFLVHCKCIYNRYLSLNIKSVFAVSIELTRSNGIGIVFSVPTERGTCRKTIQRLHSRGALPEVDRSHPSGSFFCILG